MQRAHLEWVAAARKHPLGIADLRSVAGTVYFEAAGWFDQRTLKTFEWLSTDIGNTGSVPTYSDSRLLPGALWHLARTYLPPHPAQTRIF